MITFQEETYSNVIEEMKPLVKLQWKEIGVFDKERIPLKPNWEWYQILADKKNLHIITARNNQRLIGYYVSIITPHIHYMDTLIAENDVLYLQKEYRKGLTGYKLIKFAVEQLKSKVQIIILSMKAKQSFLPLADRLGFKLTDYKLTLEI